MGLWSCIRVNDLNFYCHLFYCHPPYPMTQNPESLPSLTPSETSSKSGVSASNPVAAAGKLKSVSEQIHLMKRRFQVLKVQEEYNKYRTIDHEKRIDRHNFIHEQIAKDREEMCKSLKAIRDTSSVRQQTKSIRMEIREGLDSSQQQLKNLKRQSVLMKREESEKWQKEMQSKKDEDRLNNKKKREAIREEERKRKADKLKAFKLDKVKKEKNFDSTNLIQRASHEEQELQKLQQAEQELLRMKQQSIQSSRIVREDFTKLMQAAPLSNRPRRSSTNKKPQPASDIELVMV